MTCADCGLELTPNTAYTVSVGTPSLAGPWVKVCRHCLHNRVMRYEQRTAGAQARAGRKVGRR